MMNTPEFQSLVATSLLARLHHTEHKALAFLALDALLTLFILLTMSGPWALAMALVAAVALVCAALTLLAESGTSLYSEAYTGSYETYRRALRQLTEESITEELAQRGWRLERRLRQKVFWLHTALILTLAVAVLIVLTFAINS